MSKFTFLGLEQGHWQFINTFADWLSGIGTLAAVIVSLYLASRHDRAHAHLVVGLRLIVATGEDSAPPEYLVFKIVNHGARTLHIKTIGWRVGLWRKRYAIQMYEDKWSSKLPITLEHGEEAQWMFPTDLREEPWARYFADGFLSKGWWPITRVTLRGQAFSSLGDVFSVAPERDLLDKLSLARATAIAEGHRAPSAP